MPNSLSLKSNPKVGYLYDFLYNIISLSILSLRISLKSSFVLFSSIVGLLISILVLISIFGTFKSIPIFPSIFGIFISGIFSFNLVSIFSISIFGDVISIADLFSSTFGFVISIAVLFNSIFGLFLSLSILAFVLLISIFFLISFTILNFCLIFPFFMKGFFLTFIFVKPNLFFLKLTGLSTDSERISFKKQGISPFFVNPKLIFGFILIFTFGTLGIWISIASSLMKLFIFIFASSFLISGGFISGIFISGALIDIDRSFPIWLFNSSNFGKVMILSGMKGILPKGIFLQ